MVDQPGREFTPADLMLRLIPAGIVGIGTMIGSIGRIAILLFVLAAFSTGWALALALNAGGLRDRLGNWYPGPARRTGSQVTLTVVSYLAVAALDVAGGWKLR